MLGRMSVRRRRYLLQIKAKNTKVGGESANPQLRVRNIRPYSPNT